MIIKVLKKSFLIFTLVVFGLLVGANGVYAQDQEADEISHDYGDQYEKYPMCGDFYKDPQEDCDHGPMGSDICTSDCKWNKSDVDEVCFRMEYQECIADGPITREKVERCTEEAIEECRDVPKDETVPDPTPEPTPVPEDNQQTVPQESEVFMSGSGCTLMTGATHASNPLWVLVLGFIPLVIRRVK